MKMRLKNTIFILLLFLTTSIIFADPADTVVYITRTGEKYHREYCQYLRRSKIETSLGSAVARGYGACSRCRPPSLLTEKITEQIKQTDCVTQTIPEDLNARVAKLIEIILSSSEDLLKEYYMIDNNKYEIKTNGNGYKGEISIYTDNKRVIDIYEIRRYEDLINAIRFISAYSTEVENLNFIYDSNFSYSVDNKITLQYNKKIGYQNIHIVILLDNEKKEVYVRYYISL